MLYTFKVTINNNGTSTVIQQEACLCHTTLPQYPSAPETQYVRGSAQRCILQPSHALSSLHPLYLSQFSPVIFGHLLSLLVTTRSNFLPENDYEIINAHFFLVSKVHYYLHKGLPPVRILNHLNSVHTGLLRRLRFLSYAEKVWFRNRSKYPLCLPLSFVNAPMKDLEIST